ncbi:MAG: hypothetical protein JWM21_3428 [Acidobacteria bacterium]|nr:hypothetical protein [Acidobacteriota bacterium]
MTTSNQHIPFATLADLAEDKIPAERNTLMQHVTSCSSCSAELGRLTRLINLMREDTAEDAPRDVFAYAINIFQQRASTNEPSLVRRLVAALSFDSANAAPAFGMRSGTAAVRQLLFAADKTDLDIRIETMADGLIVSGQVLGDTCVGGEVTLAGPAATVSAPLNDLCEFKLSSVPAGAYTLRVQLGEVELEIPHLELGG